MQIKKKKENIGGYVADAARHRDVRWYTGP